MKVREMSLLKLCRNISMWVSSEARVFSSPLKLGVAGRPGPCLSNRSGGSRG